MSLFDEAIYSLINKGKRTVTSPIFVKKFEVENQQLTNLIELSQKVLSKRKDLIEKDIRFLKQGLNGEQNVYYELKNSFIPMLCLHDIRLESDDYIAQFDFIIITNKFIYVLETKKLNGDIEITPDGDFIRIIRNHNGKFIKKEGMYSPIVQNERHVNILRATLKNEQLINKLPIKSAVIMANPKTIVNKTNAPKHIKQNIFKYDQISTLLKTELSKEKDRDLLEKYMYAITDFLIKNHKPITIDYISKYSLTQDDFQAKNTDTDTLKGTVTKPAENKVPSPSSSNTYDLLKGYRLTTSRDEGVKPYFIFSNEELDMLLKTMPKTKADLLKVKGFGPKKVEKYGDAILSILNT